MHRQRDIPTTWPDSDDSENTKVLELKTLDALECHRVTFFQRNGGPSDEETSLTVSDNPRYDPSESTSTLNGRYPPSDKMYGSLEFIARWHGTFQSLRSLKDGSVTTSMLYSQLNQEDSSFLESIRKGLMNLPEIHNAETSSAEELTFDRFLHLVAKVDRSYTSYFAKGLLFLAYTVLPAENRPKFAESQLARTAHTTCLSLPVFTFIISMVQLGICVAHQQFLSAHSNQNSTVNQSDPVVEWLQYNPVRRKEVWRLFSCMLVHKSWIHFGENLLVQLFLAVPLEIVQSPLRVGTLYIVGGVAGTLGASMAEPAIYLTGASGAVFALLLAHLANLLINWGELTCPCCPQCLFCKSPCRLNPCACLWLLLWIPYLLWHFASFLLADNSVAYWAHIYGAICGLLFGVACFKNQVPLEWQDAAWWVCLGLTVMFFVYAVLWNCLWSSYPVQEL